MGKALAPLKKHQLPSEVKERLEELRALSDKAEEGDKDARRQLRELLRESGPEVVARASDVGRRAQHMLIELIAAREPLMESALSGRLDLMREEVAGDNPTPLEVLLTEQVVSCWLWLQVLDALMSAQYRRNLPEGAKRSSPSYLLKQLKIQESAHRRFLSSAQALARVRKLQTNTPAVQVNTQINVRKGGGGR